MERTISIDERIRRAEQIYERRKQSNTRQVATVNVNEKKDYKLLRKLFIQVLICSLVYTIIYSIGNSNYPFSSDFMNKANEILTYDTNFVEVYENVKKIINGFLNRNEQEKDDNIQEDSIGGSVEENSDNQEQIGNENEEKNIESENNEKNSENNDGVTEESQQPLSQLEQDIINIKNTTSFIKPIEGFISSKYGQRPNATGNVPKNHTGVDIAANMGTPIKSATDGEVVLNSEQGDYRETFKNTNWRS